MTRIDNIRLINFGIFETKNEELEHSINSPSTYFLRSSEVNLIQQTDLIFAKIGVRFGIEYFIESKNSEDVKFISKISHPKMKNPNNSTYVNEVVDFKHAYPNQKNFDYFLFEFNWELVKGVWVFELIQNNNILLKKQFNVE